MKYCFSMLFSISMIYSAAHELVDTNERGALSLKELAYNVIQEHQIVIPPSYGGLLDYHLLGQLPAVLSLDDVPLDVYIPIDLTAKYVAVRVAELQEKSWDERTETIQTDFGPATLVGKGFVEDRALLFDAMAKNEQVRSVVERIQKKDVH